MTQAAFDHPLSCGTAVFWQQILFQRAGINTDADRDVAFGSELDDFFDAPTGADVARIETQPIDALLQSDQRQLIIKVNVCNQWNTNSFFDLAELLRRLAHRHGNPYDVTIGRFQRPNLMDHRL